MNPPAAHAIVFDLDDTLFDEKDYVLSGFRAADALATSWGLRGFYEAAKQRLERGERGKIFDAVLAELEGMPTPSPERVRALVAAYREHTPELRLGAAEAALLRELRQRGKKLGIITDGYLTVQQKKVAALGLTPLVDAIIYSDTWGRESWKPSLRPFREMERACKNVRQPFLAVASEASQVPQVVPVRFAPGLVAPAVLGTKPASGATTPAQYIYIGDNPDKDFIGARTAGWYSIRLNIPNREHSQKIPPPANAPDATVTSIEELSALLRTT